MGNGGHTLELVKQENERVIESMRRAKGPNVCSNYDTCITGFDRMFSLVEMLFQIAYERPQPAPQPPSYKMYVPKSIKEALLIALTKSPWAITAMVGIVVGYAIYFNKLIPITLGN